MNFFSRQDTLQAQSRRMIGLFIFSVICILLLVNLTAHLIFFHFAGDESAACATGFIDGSGLYNNASLAPWRRTLRHEWDKLWRQEDMTPARAGKELRNLAQARDTLLRFPQATDELIRLWTNELAVCGPPTWSAAERQQYYLLAERLRGEWERLRGQGASTARALEETLAQAPVWDPSGRFSAQSESLVRTWKRLYDTYGAATTREPPMPKPVLSFGDNLRNTLTNRHFWPFHLTVCLITLLLIGVPAASRFAKLRDSGGDRIAEELGSQWIDPASSLPAERRLNNVTQEMAIAAGIPVPNLYVMPSEWSINALAAGHDFEDAVIIVSQGALNDLSRDELQGVVAHEFHHIQSGDMLLNMRMMALLHGFIVLSRAGRFLMGHILDPFGLRDRKQEVETSVNAIAVYAVLLGIFFLLLGSGFLSYLSTLWLFRILYPLAVFGAALAVLGLTGNFFARLIRASISRRREFLADVAAVRLTRNLDGITGALKKIGGFTGTASKIIKKRQDVSHMLFASGKHPFLALLATHPPIAERIAALDAHFRAEGLPERQEPATDGASAFQDSGVVFFAGDGGPQAMQAPTSAGAESDEELWRRIPGELLMLAHSREEALTLTLALLLGEEERPASCDRMRRLIWEEMGIKQVRRVNAFMPQVRNLHPRQAILLLRECLPRLRSLPEEGWAKLPAFIDRLIASDRRITSFEDEFSRCLKMNDEAEPAPVRGRAPRTGN